MHGLPLKLRFKKSKIYLSVFPVVAIGIFIGFVGAILGIGGGFILIPLLIYVLRVPTGTVIGTSMVLTLVTMSFATVLHATTNHLVDAVLALILMVGGVIGAQFGARAGQRISSEQLRLLLGLLILSVGIRFAVELTIRPDELFMVARTGARPMRSQGRDRAGACLLTAALTADARAERLIASVSNHRVTITPEYSGDELVLFGSIERDADTPGKPRQLRPRRHGGRAAHDHGDTAQGKEARHLDQYRLARVHQRSVLSRRVRQPTDQFARRRRGPAPSATRPQQHHPDATGAGDFADVVPNDPFRVAFVRLRANTASIASRATR